MSNGRQENLFDVKYKVLLLGDTLVGKTSLQRFIAGKDFRTDIGATVGTFIDGNPVWNPFVNVLGVDFVNKIIPVEQSKINLQIWWVKCSKGYLEWVGLIQSITHSRR